MGQQERLPFGAEYEPKKTPNKGLKIKSDRSQFSKIAEQRQKFEENADAFIAQRNARNKEALELAKKFMGLVKDKTLPENKTPISKDVENEVINDLIQFALDINDDPEERNGMGSSALINLLFKVVLVQRDAINQLDYKIAQLTKQLSSLKADETSPTKK